MFKKAVKDLLDKKVLFYYRDLEDFYEVVTIDRNTQIPEYTWNTYHIPKTSCPGNPICLEDFFVRFIYSGLEMEELLEAQVAHTHQLLEKLGIIAKDYIPTLQADVEAIEDQLFLF